MASPHSQQSCSIRDLAKYVGLSTCTVSRALNGPGGQKPLPEKTRQLVMEAAQKLGYVPSINAQRLFRKRSEVIGLLLPRFQDETENTVFLDQHLALLMGSISSALQGSGYHLMLLFNEGKTEHGRYESMFRSCMLDGLLVWGIRREDFCWKELVSMQTPTLFIGTTPDAMETTPFNFVASDYAMAAYEVTRKLLSGGCRAPLLLLPEVDISVKDEMLLGVKRALTEKELPEKALLTTPWGYTQMGDFSKLFEKIGRADGVIAPSDNTVRVLQSLLPSIGRSLPVVCVDCAENCVVPGIPTIVSQDREIGQQAVKALLGLIKQTPAKKGSIQLKVPGVKRAF